MESSKKIPKGQLAELKTLNGETMFGSGDIVVTGGTASSGTGNIINLSNVVGTYYNMTSANTATTYTFLNQIIGGKSIVLVNAASQPSVTGATNIYGDSFEANVNMYMTVWNNGNRTEYFFTKIIFGLQGTESPTYLNYTALAIDSLTLSWDSNSAETNFSVERSSDGITFTEVSTPTSNLFSDSGLIASTNYYYKVKVKSTTKESSYSNIIFVKTTNAQSEALTNKMSVAGDAAPAFNKSIYAIGVKNLVDNSIFAQSDFFNLFSAHGETSALLNWISTSHNSIKGGTPVFTSNRGFKGNGTDGFIRTAYNPLTQAVNLLENNGMVSVFTLDSTTENPALFEANSDSYAKRILINPKNAGGNISVKFNASGGGAVAQPNNTIGLHTLVRLSSTSFSYYLNGVLFGTYTNTSNGLPNGEFYTFASELSGTVSTFSNRQASMIFAGSGNINPLTFYNSIKEMMMVSSGFSPTIWGGAISGNYPALSVAGQTFVNAWEPTAVNDRAYNHHPFIIEFGGAIHIMYSTANTDEEQAGTFVRYQKSIDGGLTFSTPIELVVPQDGAVGFAARRICLPSIFTVLDGELFAIVDINDRATGSAGDRFGVGTLAIKINSDATFTTPVWIINPSGNTTAPTAKSGFASYLFDTILASRIINNLINSERRPSFFYSCPTDNPMYTVSSFKGTRMEEPTVIKLPNGLWMKLWRVLDTTYKKIAQYSFDGINWGGLNTTNIPDWHARSEFLKLSDGRIVLTGNNTFSANRTPLYITQSSDGLNFKSTNIYNIDTETTGAVYTGVYKTTGVSYPHLTQLANGKIAVVYSVNKEKIRVSIFTMPAII
jgi:hypothetical protein